MQRVFVSVAALAFATAVQAQGSPMSSSSSGVSFTAAAGASFPTGDFSDFAKTGFNVLGGVGFSVMELPVGFRAEVMYNRFGAKDNTGADNSSVLSGGLNVIFQIPLEGSGIQPYVTGGLGYARVEASADVNSGDFIASRGSSMLRGSVSSTAQLATVTTHDNGLLWNLGGGVKWALSGFDAFVEGRYVQAGPSDFRAKFIPVFFGVTFRP